MDFKLADAGLGAVSERFDAALQQMVENVLDPNTDPTKKRSVVIKFEYTPSKTSRQYGDLVTSVETKLAPLAPLVSGLAMGINQETGEMNAREHVQMEMFPDQAPVGRTGDPATLADDIAKQDQKLGGGHITPFKKQQNQ